MRFRRRETGLEFRVHRPQPREEFVRELSELVEPARRRRHGVRLKLALVAAVTGVLAASLGVAGALGSASSSVHAFGVSVVHLVQPAHTTSIGPRTQLVHAHGSSANVTPRTHSVPTSRAESSPAPAGATSLSAGGAGTPVGPGGHTSYRVIPAHYPPFNWQYGFRIPVCWNGHVIYVTLREVIWYVFHGARPARFCGTGLPSGGP